MFLFVLVCLGFICAFPLSASSIQQRDKLSREVKQRAADRWFMELNEALRCHQHDDSPVTVPETLLVSEVDQERIYKLLLTGLIYNYHRNVNCDMIEALLARAIKLIKSSALIFSKMMANPKKCRSPFQKLYFSRDFDDVRSVLADVAKRGSWDYPALTQRAKTYQIEKHQQFLQNIKADASFNHRVTVDGDPLIEALKFTRSHLEQLTQRTPSLMQLEIAVTLFQLNMDIRDYVLSFYQDLDVEKHYMTVIETLVSLTTGNLKHTMKVVDILVDKAPELLVTFWNARNVFRKMQQNTYRKVYRKLKAKTAELHPTEIVMNFIESCHDATDSEITSLLLVPGCRCYQDSVRDLKSQKALRGQKWGSLYYFHVQLLKSMARLCNDRAIDGEGMAHFGAIVRCTAVLVPFDVEMGNSTKEMMTITLNEMLRKFETLHGGESLVNLYDS